MDVHAAVEVRDAQELVVLRRDEEGVSGAREIVQEYAGEHDKTKVNAPR